MLGFNNICFVGQDLAAAGEKQYADGATNILPAHSQLSMFNIEVPGFNGESVMTRNSFEYQIKRCAEIAVEWQTENPTINLVNATEGGAFLDGFNHMTLAEFAKSRNLIGQPRNKAVSFDTRTQITNIEIERFLSELSITMGKIIYISNMIVKLDQQTRRTKGLEKKIQKTVQKFQKLNDECSLLQIAMQEDIAKVIGTSKSTQHVDSHAEFFQNQKKCHCHQVSSRKSKFLHHRNMMSDKSVLMAKFNDQPDLGKLKLVAQHVTALTPSSVLQPTNMQVNMLRLKNI